MSDTNDGNDTHSRLARLERTMALILKRVEDFLRPQPEQADGEANSEDA